MVAFWRPRVEDRSAEPPDGHHRPGKKKGQGVHGTASATWTPCKNFPRVVDFVTTRWYHVTTQKGGADVNKNPKERTEFVQIRVTPAEKEQLKALAVAAGVSVTGYILGRALGDAIGQTILKGFDRR